MAEITRKPRDRKRIAAWSSVAVVALGFGIAGVVYDPAAEIGTLCGSASFALDIGAIDFAKEQLALAADQDPDDPWVLLLGSRVAFAEQDTARATALLDRLLAIDPGHEEAHLYYAYAAWEGGDWLAAREHYRKGGNALERTGREDLVGEYLVRLGLLEIAAGDFAAADAIANRLLALDLRPAAGHLISAFSHLGRGDDTNHRRALERAYACDPREPLFRQGPGPLSRAFPWLPAPRGESES
jgi:tetratricopeptide (TPR) repeat protein